MKKVDPVIAQAMAARAKKFGGKKDKKDNTDTKKA